MASTVEGMIRLGDAKHAHSAGYSILSLTGREFELYSSHLMSFRNFLASFWSQFCILIQSVRGNILHAFRIYAGHLNLLFSLLLASSFYSPLSLYT